MKILTLCAKSFLTTQPSQSFNLHLSTQNADWYRPHILQPLVVCEQWCHCLHVCVSILFQHRLHSWTFSFTSHMHMLALLLRLICLPSDSDCLKQESLVSLWFHSHSVQAWESPHFLFIWGHGNIFFGCQSEEEASQNPHRDIFLAISSSIISCCSLSVLNLFWALKLEWKFSWCTLFLRHFLSAKSIYI